MVFLSVPVTPLEIKQKLENSFEVWASTSGTYEWLEKMGLNQKQTEPVKEESNNGKT